MDVDPVGACVGLKGVRITNVIRKLEGEKIDVTLPATKIRRGSKHPMSLAIEEIEDVISIL